MKPYDLARLANEILSGEAIKEANDTYSPANDYEGEMAITQLKAMIEKAQAVLAMLKPEAKLESWVQSKITLADDYMSSVSDYLKHTDGAVGESVEVTEAMNNYLAFYNGKKIAVQAETSYKAQLKAAEMLKVPEKKQYMITVKLAEEVEMSEAPMIAPPDETLRGYSPAQFENKFRELLGRLGFSKSLPIKKFGTSFWVSFENMPKARDFSMTIENMMRRSLKPGVKLTKILSVEADDPSIAKGIVPKTTRAIVVVNLGNVVREAFESYGFMAEDFYKNTKEEV